MDWKIFGRDKLPLNEKILLRTSRYQHQTNSQCFDYVLTIMRQPFLTEPRKFAPGYYEMKDVRGFDWIEAPEYFDWLELVREIEASELFLLEIDRRNKIAMGIKNVD